MNCKWANSLRVLVLLMPLMGGMRLCAQWTGEKGPTLPAGVVREIRVLGEDGKVLVVSPKGVSVKIGEPLNRDDVAASIRSLYQTGDYADLQAVVTRTGEGLRLDFVARENIFINQVIMEGLKPPPSEASASGAMQLSLGQTFRSGDLDDAIARLKETLQDEGLYQAKVTVEQYPHADTHQLDLVVRVDPGPRVRLSKVDLTNDTEYSNAALLKLFRLKTGSELTIARVQSATGRIRKFLEKKGHLKKRQEERAYLYLPAKPQKQVIGSMIQEFIQRVFNGSAEPLLAHLIEDEHLHLVTAVAARLIRRYGSESLDAIAELQKQAVAMGDKPSARTWLDITAAAEGLLAAL